ncbi:FecCD family ABC transporter permease [Amycolatopsis sp. VC5-11]|uniref:FecCD family ABC transporter permease n=1 Tax=Amycolatopsis sp. VC5-11 TaxID=3120156 RepID=UPI003009EAA5
MNRTARLVLPILAVLVAGLLIAGLLYGDFPLSPSSVLRALAGTADPRASFFVLDVRLPRSLLAVTTGAAFGLAGAIVQSLVRNPLASPDVLGTTSGAAAAAVSALLLFGWTGPAVSGAALAGGLVTTGAVHLLATARGRNLVLIGVAVAALLAGGVSWLLTVGEVTEAQAALVWLTGTLDGRSWPELVPLLWFTIPAALAVVPFARPLTLLGHGDDLARSLGVEVGRTRVFLTIAATVLASAATAAVGPVAFVALTAPALARLLTGRREPSLAASALLGCTLLMLADLLARSLSSPAEIPVGVVTGIVGGAYLLFLLVGRGMR